MRPEGTQLTVSMPCRPASRQRDVLLAGRPVSMRLFACHAHGATFALGHAVLGDPNHVNDALDALAEAARANVQGTTAPGEPAQVGGMTPNPRARQWRWTGRLPDGQAVTSWVTVFSYGLHVYQATVIGPAVDESLVRHFRTTLAVRPVSPGPGVPGRVEALAVPMARTAVRRAEATQ
jgi:hypothetical protein